MKAKFGSIIVDGSGKLGGTDVMHNRSKNILRTRSIPRNRQSNSQHVQRGLFRTIKNSWRLLTESQRSSWNKAANTRNYFKSKSGSNFLSGEQFFTSCNLNLSSINESTITDFFEDSIDVQPLITFAWYDIVYNRLLIGIDDYIPNNYSMVVYATKPLSLGVTKHPKTFKKILVTDSADQLCFDLTSYYSSVYGSWDVSQYTIFFKVVFISKNSGFSTFPRYTELVENPELTCIVFWNGVTTVQFQLNVPIGSTVYIKWGNGTITEIIGTGVGGFYPADYSGDARFYKVSIYGDIPNVTDFRFYGTFLYMDTSSLLPFAAARIFIFSSPNVFGSLDLLNYRLDYLYFDFYNNDLVYGDVSQFLSSVDLVRTQIFPNPNVTYIHRVLSMSDGSDINYTSNSWDSSTVDQVLIDCAADDSSNKTLHLAGTNAARTAASDAAKATLLGRGWTIYVNE